MSITVSEVSKSYGTQQALQAISFTIKKGEITGFLGPNGAGKSTMMKILTGYISPTSGIVKVNGYDMATSKKKVQQSVGYLPENNPLYLDMYVREYLKFNAGLHHLKNPKIDELIERTGLLPEAHKKIQSLSKGYRQRVGLAAALLHDPEVLILDEPTTGLDPNQLVDIRELIKTIGKEKTVLLSTHIMQEVEAICDRAIIIDHGIIVADKRLAELQDEKEQLLVVEFDYRVEEVALQQLHKVIAIKNTTRFCYEILFDTKRDMRPAVFDFAHDNGLKILQLNKKNTNLESLFQDLTKNN
ncbi:gliding motility-associated ABC transporter ATP-binding subunit GldA [Flavimarina sp. Hel_I_48]|uniref:gliding motility-associated ABC transporter ATP-binding subunit GldA n=1 Tax=Flavimarina sp. Hel_I_48 TaxID=1392488 RepID=UPI0004DED1CD|nr:gliding motility-associated ABC transporter ATP-binding subunit GldA [Flavimarina sp. Hel_I_48]